MKRLVLLQNECKYMAGNVNSQYTPFFGFILFSSKKHILSYLTLVGKLSSTSKGRTSLAVRKL